MKRLTLLLLILFSLKGFSNHISGGEITYSCLGGNLYQIKLTYYWDCIGGFNPGTSQVVSVNGCGNALSLTVTQSTLTPGAGVSVAGVCPGYTLSCKNRIDYFGTITLPSACNSWTFSLGSCCRGGSITNLTGGTTASYYHFATLNNVTAPCNNSPYFTAPPLPYYCLNQPACFNLGTVETDGNTLSYSLVSAFQTGTTFVNYAAGYTGTAPISGITINAVTGQVNFTPTALGDFVVVVMVTEKDAMGNIIGTVMRDVQVVVINCTNLTTGCTGGVVSNPTAGTTSTLTPYSLQICEGVPFCFDINFTDPNPGDSIKFSSPNILTALPGSTYTTTYSTINSMTVHICWTPAVGTANTNTNFNAIIKDNACPVPGVQYYTYNINVLPAANAGPDITICGAQTATINSSGPGALFTWKNIYGALIPVGPAFSCNPCQNPVVSPATTQTYVLHTNGAVNCVNSDTMVVKVVPDFTLTASANIANGCLNSLVQYTSTVTPALAGYSYTWAPASVLSSTSIAAPTASYNLPGNYTYTLTAVSPLGCKKQTAPGSVTILPVAPANFSALPLNDTVLCGNGNVQLNIKFLNGTPTSCALAATGCVSPNIIQVGPGAVANTSTSWPAPYGNYYKNSRHQILYLASDLLAAGAIPGKISSVAFFVSALNTSTLNYPNYTISMKCTSLTAFPSTQAFETGLVQVYSTPLFSVTTGWNTHNFNQAYEWDGVSNIILETCYSMTSAFTQNCSSTSTYKPFITTKVYYSDATSACGPASPSTTSWAYSNYMPNAKFGNCNSTQNPLDYNYSWAPPLYLNSTTIKNPLASSVSSNIQYTVTVSPIGASTCPRTDTVRIKVNPAFTNTITSGAPFCTNAPASTLSIAYTGTTTGVVTNTWTGSGITNSVTGVFNPSVSGPGNIKVYVTMLNNGCFRKDSISMSVEQYIASTLSSSIIPQCITNPTINLMSIPVNTVGIWSGPGVSGGVFNPLLAGVGTKTLTYSTNSLPTTTLCPSTSSLVVSVSSVVQPTISLAGPYCDNFATQTMTVTPLGGLWTSTTTATSISSSGVFDPSLSVLGNNQLIYTLTNGPCVKSDSTIINVVQFIPATITGTFGPYCIYDPATALQPGAQNIGGVWSGAGVSGGIFTPSVALPGTHVITYSTNPIPLGLCPDIKTTNIVVNDKPNANVLSDKTAGCNYPLYINFFTNSVSTGIASWNFGDGSTDMLGLSVVHAYSTPGVYSAVLTYTDNAGCVDTTLAPMSVTVFSVPVAAFEASPDVASVVDAQIQFTNQSTVLSGNTYAWDIAGLSTSTQTNPEYLFSNVGNYLITLIATNANGCKDTIARSVTVNPDVVLYVPNAFTPGNQDGLNDLFQVYLPANSVDMTTFNIIIYDRWGEIVFKSNDINKSWNGTKNNSGQFLKSETYVYKLTFKDLNRKDYEKVGHVTLLNNK